MANKGEIIISFVILLFTIFLKFILIDIYPGKVMLLNAIFWTILMIFIYKFKGVKRNKTELKRSSISIVIIWLMLYTIISFLSGLYLGFLKNSYSHTILSIINNIYSFVIMIIAEEYIKDVIIRKKNKKYLAIITILYIIIDILLLTNFSDLTTNLKIFLFITMTLIPVTIRNILSSYIVYNFSIIPSVLYRLYFAIYAYIFPIYPNLGFYLNSVIGVLIPYLIYLSLSKSLLDKPNNRVKKIKNNYTYLGTVPLTIILVIVICLVSGVFKYHIISIASGSMEPIIYRGDAIIYEKIDEKVKLKKDDIIVFRHDGKVITHRLYEVIKRNNKEYYITKGDNNPSIDGFELETSDIIGIMRVRIKYIGIPSLWFSEIFN